MEKINVAELLENCPKGMELYSTIYGTVYFEGVRDTGHAVLIDVKTSCNTEVQFYPDGKFNTYYSDSEMTLFPSKDVRTWEGFIPPCKFKEGDVVCTTLNSIAIIKDKSGADYIVYCGVTADDDFYPYVAATPMRLATEEEKEKLFQAIKDNGYKWNPETKTLEKLEQPQYPKTYKECCDILGLNTMDNDAQGYKWNLIIRLQELIICRDAYWVVFIGGPWCPDYEIDEDGTGSVKFCIKNMGGKIKKIETAESNTILAFPTAEMRDAFYKNFKESIERSKELL